MEEKHPVLCLHDDNNRENVENTLYKCFVEVIFKFNY